MRIVNVVAAAAAVVVIFSQRFIISSFFSHRFHALFAKRHFEKLMMYEYVGNDGLTVFHWHAAN